MSHFYNEHNAYRAAVLRERIEEGLLPQGIVDERDIEKIPDEDFQGGGYTQIHLFAGIGGFPLGLRRAGFPEDCRIVTGGFPCQDISNAGKRAGITGSRSGLWREMVRCIRVVRPQLIFVENVAALLGRGMERVLGDLAACGYDAEWQSIRASDVGAPHRRERIWIVAYSDRCKQRGRVFAERSKDWRDTDTARNGEERQLADAIGRTNGRLHDRREDERAAAEFAGRSESLADADEPRPAHIQESNARREGFPGRLPAGGSSLASTANHWAVEPNVGRVAHGISKRVDRLAALGDAIVPQCVEEIVRRLKK